MKKNVTPVTLVILALFFIFPDFVSAQTNFNPEDYKQFIIDNKDLDSDVFLQRYDRDGLYYSSVEGAGNLSAYMYLDSIVEKYRLTDDEIELLLSNQFMVSERLSFEKMTPALDDIFEKDLPVFVSTDAILHALHISYDNLLRDIEMQMLLEELQTSLDALYNGLPGLIDKYGEVEAFQASLADVDLYITIALSLLNEGLLEPQFSAPQNVRDVWAAIESEAFVSMPLFTDIDRLLDFSQFTIRGHYAKYEELHGYFKSMMWLGRMEFVLAEAPHEWYEDGFTREGLRRLNISALILNELLEASGALDPLSEIDRIIAFMVGESDNLRPGDYSSLVREAGIGSPEYLLDEDNFDAYLHRLTSRPEYQQKILSGYMKGTPEVMEPTPLPVSYRLMGQRFIIDSYIFYKLVYDNIIYHEHKICRMMPDPLDALFSLGNDNALPLLEEELETWNYSSQLAGLRYLIDEFDEEFWNESLYNCWLHSIRLLNGDEANENLPLFMKTVAWQQEKMNTQLASWAQLRHDNLLYAKQSYTHGGECMFPYSYVEPYPAFYRQLAAFAEKAESFDAFRDIRGTFTYQSVAEYFDAMKYAMGMLEQISVKELNGVFLDQEEIDFLGDMIIEGNASGPEFNGWYVDLLYDSDGGPSHIWDPSQSDFVIADVHTQPTDCAGNVVGRILHAGTGQVNLGVFLANAPYGEEMPMAFIGPVMTYYQTITDNFERLTDEAWTEMIQRGDLPARPDWVNVYLADREGKKYEEGRVLEGVNYSGIADLVGPSDFGFGRIYPNPFSNNISISYSVGGTASAGKTEISVFNITGQKVASLVSEMLPEGDYSIEWDASALDIGLYFLQLRVEDKIAVRKVVKR